MLNLVTFEQLFHIFLRHLEMQADYVKTDLIVTVQNMRTRVYVQKDVNYFSIEIGYFISLVDSVIHQYISI